MTSTRHLTWVLLGALVALLTSFVLGDWILMPVDVYYLLYFAVILGFLGFYVRRTRLPLRDWVCRRWSWGLALGVVFGLFLARGVFSLPATAQLSGGALAWAVGWRGLAYGAVDGLLLFAFPWVVVWRALGAEGARLSRKVGAAALAWIAILFMTTIYHLGYSDFRSRKIVQPNVGSTIAAVPTLVSANPVASALSHVFLHTAAVVHIPQTDLFLPPHRP